MRVARYVATGAIVVGASAGLAVLGSGSASAIGVAPVPGGIAVDLSHAETVWAYDNNVGGAITGLPHPSAASFGLTFDSAAALALGYPQGRVGFTVLGPVNDLNGVIVAYAE